MVNNNIKIVDGYIKLPKIGYIKMVEHRPFKGIIKTVTVKKVPSGKYFVSITAEVKVPKLPSTGKTIGIDVGISDFCTDSNGNHYDNPKYLDKSLKKLKRAQRCLSRKSKGSGNYNKQRIKVAKIHEHITNQRIDHHHKLSTQLVSENQTIVIEHLDVKKMLVDTKFARCIADAAWGKFFTLLEEKAIIYERELIKVDTFYPSSQLCSCCGYKNPLTKNLNVRSWTCPSCNTKHNRDENAAINILSKGLELRSEA
jgi:putative transposase